MASFNTKAIGHFHEKKPRIGQPDRDVYEEKYGGRIPGGVTSQPTATPRTPLENCIQEIRGPDKNMWRRHPHPRLDTGLKGTLRRTYENKDSAWHGTQGFSKHGVDPNDSMVSLDPQQGGMRALSVLNPVLNPKNAKDMDQKEYTSGYVSLVDVFEDDKADTRKGKPICDIEGLHAPFMGCYKEGYQQDNFASCIFIIPGVNLIWTFIDTEIDPPSWDQICRMLDTFAIVVALSLALASTFLTTITFEEMRGANSRFAHYGFNSETQAWDTDWTITVPHSQTENYNELNTLANAYTDANNDKAFSFPGSDEAFTPVANPWSLSAPFPDPRAPGPCEDDLRAGGELPSNTKCMVNVTCAAPCFYDRYVADYKWIDSKYYGMWQYGQADKAATPLSSQFSRDINTSCGFLVTSLFLTVVVLALGSPNIFFRNGNRKINGYFRGGNENSEGHQYRTIARAYFYWVRWVILAIVLFALVGIVFFFEAQKFLTYMKYTDWYLEQNRGKSIFNSSPPPDATYSQAQSYLAIYFYLATFVGFVLISTGHRAAYMYPINSRSNMSDVKNQTKRLALRMDLIKFLHFECNIYSHTFQCHDSKDGLKHSRFGPKIAMSDMWRGSQSVSNDPSNNRDPLSTHQIALELRRGVYGSGAGGVAATDAEVVADVLIDNAFLVPEDLLELQTLGIQSVLYELPGIHFSVVGLIISACRRMVDDKSFRYVLHNKDGKATEYRLGGDNEGDTFRPLIKM